MLARAGVIVLWAVVIWHLAVIVAWEALKRQFTRIPGQLKRRLRPKGDARERECIPVRRSPALGEVRRSHSTDPGDQAMLR